MYSLETWLSALGQIPVCKCLLLPAPPGCSWAVSVSLCSVSLCVAVFLSDAHCPYALALPLRINPCLWRHTDPWVSEEEQKYSVKRPLTGTNKEVKFHALLFILLLRAALKQQHVTWSLGTLP